jgi:hypothetical protein
MPLRIFRRHFLLISLMAGAWLLSPRHDSFQRHAAAAAATPVARHRLIFML